MILCFVLANLATVTGGNWVPKCQASTAIPLGTFQKGKGGAILRKWFFIFLRQNGISGYKVRINFPDCKKDLQLPHGRFKLPVTTV